MSLKLSRYSYLFSKERKYYLFNSESCFFSEIEKVIYNLLEDREYEKLNLSEKKFLLKKKILVKKEDYDTFYMESKLNYSLNSFNRDVLGLVLVPTTGCNFACSYCFEGAKKHIFIKNEVIDELIKFINSHEDAKKINITWYGGEPLMGFSKIKEILTRIDCEIDIPIQEQSLITNGYLLNDEVINFFKTQNLNSIQITFDGNEATHDASRYLIGSQKGSYNRIVENIDKVIKELPNTKLAIRINVNHHNKNEFFPLYKEFASRWKSNNLYIYPGFIREDTVDKCSFCSTSLKTESILKFYNQLEEDGANVDLYPRKAGKGCMVNKVNDYIIGPEGEIYKCWNDVSDKSKIIGNISKKEILNKPLFYKYLFAGSCFDSNECKDCLFLPICSGGCAWYRIRNNEENGMFELCSLYKGGQRLEEVLLNSTKPITKELFLPQIKP